MHDLSLALVLSQAEVGSPSRTGCLALFVSLNRSNKINVGCGSFYLVNNKTNKRANNNNSNNNKD